MGSLIDLYVKDRHSGRIHRVGDDQHDQLTIEADGTLRYHNLQNGEGCSTRNDPRDGYMFVPNVDDYGFNMDPREEEQDD